MFHNNMNSMPVCYVTCRNYHVFYYLLIGASEEEKAEFKLLRPGDYHYLKQVTLRTAITKNQCSLIKLFQS